MDAKTLGANIRKYRKERGLTQDQIAEQCGLTPNYFGQIELGNKVPQLKTFLSIAEAKNTSTELLFSGNLSWTPRIQSDELYDKIKELPESKRQYILKSMDVLIEGVKKI